ncbi:hypothetical protein Fmac_016193 [Flemingia macrophylla]|uniref:MRN complex-interacting protein N-terminal domain-containing protein n=1 Tax=Flemingia macrophylla TaxID=520843 RepID=A0ABD1MGP0_9FABA
MSSFSATLFIALQCCQCSTMQVKQKKKSSNKWNCAVCNQKQSVRKVFAQGFMAKDVRTFVQNFNMSRKSFDDADSPLAGTLDPPLDHREGHVDRKHKRSDWSAYLDREDHHTVEEQQDRDGDDFEPLVVTELHKGMFKKRRVVEDSISGSDKFFKMPLFHNSQEEPMIDQRRVTSSTESNRQRNNYLTPDNQRTKKCKTSNKAASRWNKYITEDNENLELGWKRGFNLDHSGPCNNSITEAMTSETVEDDVHPDFK